MFYIVGMSFSGHSSCFFQYLSMLSAACFFCCAGPAVFGVSVFNFDHYQDTYNSTVHAPGGNVGPQSASILYDFPFQSVDFQNRNYGQVSASLLPGSVGISARAYNNGTYAPQRQKVVAEHRFDVLFSSPNSDSISVVMNLEMSGEFINPGNGILRINAGLASSSSYGSYNAFSSSSSSSGLLSSFVPNGTVQTLSTGSFSVPVNTPVEMILRMETGQAYGNNDPWIQFGNTLSVTSSGDAFTILGPNGGLITVTSDDIGIVDNQFTPIPEPSLIGLIFGVVALVALIGRGARRNDSMKRIFPKEG